MTIYTRRFTIACVNTFLILTSIVTGIFIIGPKFNDTLNIHRASNAVLIIISILLILVYFIMESWQPLGEVSVHNKFVRSLRGITTYSNVDEQLQQPDDGYGGSTDIPGGPTIPRDDEQPLIDGDTIGYRNVEDDIEVVNSNRTHTFVGTSEDKMGACQVLNAYLPTIGLWVFGSFSMLYSVIFVYYWVTKLESINKNTTQHYRYERAHAYNYLFYSFAKVVFTILHIAYLHSSSETYGRRRRFSTVIVCFLLATDAAVWLDSFLYSLQGHGLFPVEHSLHKCNGTNNTSTATKNVAITIKSLTDPLLFPFESKLFMILTVVLGKRFYILLHGHERDHSIETTSDNADPRIVQSDNVSYETEADWVMVNDNDVLTEQTPIRLKSKTTRCFRMLFTCVFNEYNGFVIGMFHITNYLFLIVKYDVGYCKLLNGHETLTKNRIQNLKEMLIQRIGYNFLAFIAVVSLLVLYSSKPRRYVCNADMGIHSLVILNFVQDGFVIVADLTSGGEMGYAVISVFDATLNCVQQFLQSFLLLRIYLSSPHLSATQQRLHDSSIKFLCVYSLYMYLIDTILLYKYYDLRPDLYHLFGNTWTVVLHLSIPCAAFYRYHCMSLFIRKLAKA